MAENSKISWTHHTWSPWRGCTKVSPGCAACYAEALSKRNPAVLGEWGPNGKRVVNANWRKPLQWDKQAKAAGERWRVFPSLCDWLEDREDLYEPRSRFLQLIQDTPNLDWLLLTKRPENFRPIIDRLAKHYYPLAEEWHDGYAPSNVWFGVSVENQEYADQRLPYLVKLPAAVRWVSYEPALGYVVLTSKEIAVVDWVVVGGESSQGGKQARPFNLEWARGMVRQCRRSCIPVFVKQLGARPVDSRPTDGSNMSNGHAVALRLNDPKGGDIDEFPAELRYREFPTPLLV